MKVLDKRRLEMTQEEFLTQFHFIAPGVPAIGEGDYPILATADGVFGPDLDAIDEASDELTFRQFASVAEAEQYARAAPEGFGVVTVNRAAQANAGSE